MQNKITQQCESIKDMEENIDALTEEMKKLTEVYTDTELRLEETTKNLTVTTDNLIKTTENLQGTRQELKVTTQERDEQTYLVAEHVSTETCLYGQAKQLLATVDSALTDIDGLHSKLDRKKEVEMSNEECQLKFKERFQNQISQMEEGVSSFLTTTKKYQSCLLDNTVSLLQQQQEQTSVTCQSVTNHQQRLTDRAGVVSQHSSDQTDLHSAWLDRVQEATASTQSEQTEALTDFQNNTFEPAVQHAVDSNKLSATILQRQIELLHAQKTEQEQIVNKFMSTTTAGLENLTTLVGDFFTQMTADLDETERHTAEEERLDQELEDTMLQHRQKRLELLKQTRNRKLSRQRAVRQFRDTLVDNLQEVRTGADQTKPELMGVVASNCTNNQTDLSQVLTEVDKSTGTCEDIRQNVRDINSHTQQVWVQHLATITERTAEHREVWVQHLATITEGTAEHREVMRSGQEHHNTLTQVWVQHLATITERTAEHREVMRSGQEHHNTLTQVWVQHLATITERTAEHREVIRSGQEHHNTLTQTLIKESQSHTDNLVSQLQGNLQQWAAHTQDSQTDMDTQAQFTADWSNNLSADLQRHSHDVEAFLHEELRKDIPTGKTPQRRNMTYPLQLTKTSEHDILLNDFRADYDSDPLVTDLSSSLDAVAESSRVSKTSETEEVESAPSEVGSESSCTSGVSSLSRASSKMSSKENKTRKPKLPSKVKQNNVNTTPRGKSRLPLKSRNPTEA
ncbi:kinesin-like protein KIF11 [Mizuhopecten yessoensis]|uniref:kinesin-like protein KIF11 n=1 Tax=Mizuhopecten yessoensis TaxID=6573 RepID=UPI000B458109|nr:kinesin-like protein KIF11 [Mizuhopecten yessoensis]